MKVCTGRCMLLVLATEVAAAPLIELGTLGPTVPAEPYFRGITLEGAHPAVAPEHRPAVSRWPLRSPLLSPGTVEPASFSGSVLFSLPVFVVGGDERSLAWLRRRRDTLRAAGAIGYVVEVPDQAAWDQLQTVAEGLPLFAMSGDALARELGLRHYPALLSRRGIEP